MSPIQSNETTCTTITARFHRSRSLLQFSCGLCVCFINAYLSTTDVSGNKSRKSSDRGGERPNGYFRLVDFSRKRQSSVVGRWRNAFRTESGKNRRGDHDAIIIRALPHTCMCVCVSPLAAQTQVSPSPSSCHHHLLRGGGGGSSHHHRRVLVARGVGTSPRMGEECFRKTRI